MIMVRVVIECVSTLYRSTAQECIGKWLLSASGACEHTASSPSACTHKHTRADAHTHIRTRHTRTLTHEQNLRSVRNQPPNQLANDYGSLWATTHLESLDGSRKLELIARRTGCCYRAVLCVLACVCIVCKYSYIYI